MSDPAHRDTPNIRLKITGAQSRIFILEYGSSITNRLYIIQYLGRRQKLLHEGRNQSSSELGDGGYHGLSSQRELIRQMGDWAFFK